MLSQQELSDCKYGTILKSCALNKKLKSFLSSSHGSTPPPCLLKWYCTMLQTIGLVWCNKGYLSTPYLLNNLNNAKYRSIEMT